MYNIYLAYIAIYYGLGNTGSFARDAQTHDVQQLSIKLLTRVNAVILDQLLGHFTAQMTHILLKNSE